MPIKLSPLVARAREAQRTTSPTITLILKIFFIPFSPFFLSILRGWKFYIDTPAGGLALYGIRASATREERNFTSTPIW